MPKNKWDSNKLKTEQRILETIDHILIADGYKGAAMKKLAAQAEVSNQLLYSYFGRKESMLVLYHKGKDYAVRNALDITTITTAY